MKKICILGTSKSGGERNLGDEVHALFHDSNGWVPTGDCCWRQNVGRFEPPMEHELKPFDALVVTTGACHIEAFEEVDEWLIQDLILANLSLPLVAAHRYVQARGEKGGTIVLVGSYAHDHVLSGSVAYCAAKAGLDMAARAMAWDLRETRFNVHIVHPYHIAGTPMADKVEKQIMISKGITRLEAQAYARKDLGLTAPLSASDVAFVIKRLIVTEGYNQWLTSVDLYGPVR